ncbi:MAG: TIGR04157 family glycosyltransferase, partial [bacterium]
GSKFIGNMSNIFDIFEPDYLVSLFYFIREIKTKPYCPPDIDKIIATIPAFISGLCPMDMNNCEIYYLEQILHNLGADFSPLKRTSNKPPVSEKLQEELCGQVTSYALLFPAIRPFSDCNPEYKDKVHKTLTDPVFREKILETADDKKYGIYSGLAGYILTILNEGFTDSFRPVIRPASDIPIYIFKRKSRASEYGIGTYIKELTIGLKDRDINITIVHLEAEKQEFTIKNVDDIPNWYIPLSKHAQPHSPDYDKLYRTVVHFMRLHIKNTDKIIFHLNSLLDYGLAQYLRKAFVCKILLVVHYMDWSFALKGDLSRMRDLLAEPEGNISGFPERKVLNTFDKERKVMEYADHIVCLADYSREIICRDYGIDKNKVTVIHNGLSDKAMLLGSEGRIKLREKYLIGPGEKIILFAGRLDEIKGVLYLIKSFIEIIKYEPGVSLWIVGDGAYNPLVKEAERIWNKVCFTGKINREQLFELYAIADIGAVPSLFEPFGYVAVEMMMNSLPVVVTATGGLDEIVEDGVSGLKVGITRGESSVVDTDTLFQKLIHLLQNPEERARLGQNGRSRYLQRFTANAMCEKILGCYQKLVQPEPEIKSCK